MPESSVLNKALLLLAFFLFLAVPVLFSLAGDDGTSKAPPAPQPDPDVSDVCTPSDCNPAKPCPDPDQECYSLNGAFYCCTMPPEPGMEAVGN
jgi:hypothetical protein